MKENDLLLARYGRKKTQAHDGKVITLSFAELHQDFNKNELDPKDGELLKLCDLLAAFLEAYTAVRNGVAPAEL